MDEYGLSTKNHTHFISERQVGPDLGPPDEFSIQPEYVFYHSRFRMGYQ